MRTLLASLSAGVVACATPAPPGSPPPALDGAASAERAPGAPLDLTGGRDGPDCAGEIVRRGGQAFLALPGGTLLTHAALRPVVSGAPTAFHPDDQAGGAILHRCNAGEVFLPDGTSYEGAASGAVCTGRFERDAARIGAAGWTDGEAGAVRWHGLVAEGSARVAGMRVPRARPVLREDGFYTSPTALEDESYAPSAPERYVDAGRVPYAAVRRDQGVPIGSYGVALRVRGCPRGRECAPVPFVVADHAPRAGAGSLALAHEASGLALPEAWTRRNRYRGQAGTGEVLTVFFGQAGEAGPLDAESLRARAQAAFQDWGGEARLYRCRRAYVPDADGDGDGGTGG